MSEHPIRSKREASERLDNLVEHGVRTRHEASEGFDGTEPQTPKIWAFTAGSVIVLIVVIVALQQYFDKIWNDAVYQKVLVPPSQELQDMRNRNEWSLTHYSYEDKSKGQVRIPLDRAQELFLKEAAEGKLFYPAKPTSPQSDADEKSPPPLTPAAGAAGKE